MRKIAIAIGLCATLALVSCTTTSGSTGLTPITKVDAAISKVNAKVYKYCIFLVSASAIAKVVIKNQSLADKIDAGVNEYCTNAANVVDVPTALSELGTIYSKAVSAGVKPSSL